MPKFRIYTSYFFNLLHRMIYQPDHYKGNSLVSSYNPVARDLPCDIHLINLRTMLAVSSKYQNDRFFRKSQIWLIPRLLIPFSTDSFDVFSRQSLAPETALTHQIKWH